MRFSFGNCPKCNYKFTLSDFAQSEYFKTQNNIESFCMICPNCCELLVCQEHEVMRFDFETFVKEEN